MVYSVNCPIHLSLTRRLLSIGCTTCHDTARYSLLQLRYSRVANCPGCLSISKRNGSTEASPENAFKERVQKIKEAHPEPYPRLRTDNRRISCKEFLSRYNHLANNETVDGIVVLYGRFSGVLFGWPGAPCLCT